MDLGISISSYSNKFTPLERYEIIDKCLNSLSNIKKKYNIYINIVNDTVTESHQKIINKYDFPVIKNPFNMGIAYTKNVGIKSILDQNLTYGILIDDDVIIKNITVIEKYYEAMLKTGFHHFSLYVFKDMDHEVLDFVFKDVKLKKCPSVNGCFLTFSKSSVEKTGYFNILPYKIGHEHSTFTYKNLEKKVIPFLVDISFTDCFDLNTIIEDTYDTSTYSHDENFCQYMFDENVKYVSKNLFRNTFEPVSDNIIKYYINLDFSDKRRESMERFFPEATRMNAINGLKLKDYKNLIRPEITDCNDRELACTFSHLSVIISAHKNNFNEIIIMEDDMMNIYENEWKKSIREIIDNKPENCNCVIFNSNNEEVYAHDKPYVKWRKGFWGTACYWLNKKAIDILYNKYITEDIQIDLNNYTTNQFHQADMGILYESIDAYNYTIPLFRFLDEKNLIRDIHHIQDQKINNICDMIYTTCLRSFK